LIFFIFFLRKKNEKKLKNEVCWLLTFYKKIDKQKNIKETRKFNF